MEIGILTYHRAHNFGAVLQAYGLRKFLESTGNDIHVVDYFPYYHQQMYRIFPMGFFWRWKIKQKVRFFLNFPFVYKGQLQRQILFNNFIDTHLKPEKVNISKSYDLLIYGSDQIWRYQNNPIFKGYNEVYFGNSMIAAKRKITFSASMGKMDQLADNQDFFKKVLPNFDSIAVRETVLKNKLQPFYDKEIIETLDPVFLLSKEEWLSLVPARKTTEKYILLYNLLNDPKLNSIALELSRNRNIDVIEITGSVKRHVTKEARHRVEMINGPQDFLSWILNADFIVTSSFHGVVFSILFEKKFLTYLPTNSERVVSLLGSLGISHLFTNYNIDLKEDIEINYSNVNQLLFPMIEKSRRYLKTAIEESQNKI